jgi:hypothetical protein
MRILVAIPIVGRMCAIPAVVSWAPSWSNVGFLVNVRVFGSPTLLDVTTPQAAATFLESLGETPMTETPPTAPSALAVAEIAPSIIIAAALVIDIASRIIVSVT